MPLSTSRRLRDSPIPMAGSGPSLLGDPSAKQPGASPPEGARLPNLSGIRPGLTQVGSRWRYRDAEGERIVEFCPATAVRRHAGMPLVLIRWVLVRDPLSRFEPQALLCTGRDCVPEQILLWFVQR